MYKKGYLLLCWLLLAAVCAPAQPGSHLRVERDVIEARLRQYEGLNEERAATMKRLFAEAGCGGHFLKEQPVPRFEAPNIICTLPGAGREVIIVGAHFDYIYEGDGVVDNWSGAALLPSLFESIGSIPRRHTFIFIGFSEEEKGMIGSAFYVKRLAKETISRIRAMVNLDSLGLGPARIWVSDSDPGLVRRLVSLASAMELPVYGTDPDIGGNSDGASFKRRNIPVITIHSIAAETFGILHTGDDTFSAMKLDDYYDSYKLIAGYLVYLDQASGHGGEADVESDIQDAVPASNQKYKDQYGGAGP